MLTAMASSIPATTSNSGTRFNKSLNWGLPAGPIIVASLSNDTAQGGLKNNDGITSDPAVGGTVTGGAVAGFKAAHRQPAQLRQRLLRSAIRWLFRVQPRLNQPDQSGHLGDGLHTLHLQATNAFGGPAGSFDLPFTLDTTVPSPSFDLSSTSDTGTIGDQSTTASRVLLVGVTEPGASLTLTETGAASQSSNFGEFQFPNVSLACANSFTVQSEDLAGNKNQSTRVLTRVSGGQTNAVIAWNQAALNAITLDATDPPHASRNLAMVQSAVYDAVNAIDGTPAYYVAIAAPAGSSAEAAVDQAAYRVLTYLYPAQKASFDSLLTSRLSTVATGQSKTDGLTVGQAAGDTIIGLRATRLTTPSSTSRRNRAPVNGNRRHRRTPSRSIDSGRISRRSP